MTYTSPGDDEPTTTMTDATGGTELVREASATAAASARHCPVAEPSAAD
ncbi:MAG: hypothetical protein HOV83_35705 [Catenulispora sp.]|nr:hypothetical protein [Catenulispora sp.]